MTKRPNAKNIRLVVTSTSGSSSSLSTGTAASILSPKETSEDNENDSRYNSEAESIEISDVSGLEERSEVDTDFESESASYSATLGLDDSSLRRSPRSRSTAQRRSPRKRMSGKIEYSDEDEGEGEDEDDEFRSTSASSPKRLTARQRSMLAPSAEETDNASSVDAQPYGTTPVMSAEKSTEAYQLMRSEKARKRRHQNELKLEEAKQATIQRLLKKQPKKVRKSKDEIRETAILAGENAASPVISATTIASSSSINASNGQLPSTATRYLDARDQTVLILGSAVSLESTKASEYPKPEKCGAPGCTRMRRYQHSQLNTPVCSLQCYKIVDAR